MSQHRSDVFLNFAFDQKDVLIRDIFVIFINILQHSVKCVISLLLVLNVGVFDDVFKCLGNRFVHGFLTVMVTAVAKSLGRTKVMASFVSTLLQWADPSIKTVLKPEITERGNIFGVDGMSTISAVGL